MTNKVDVQDVLKDLKNEAERYSSQRIYRRTVALFRRAIDCIEHESRRADRAFEQLTGEGFLLCSACFGIEAEPFSDGDSCPMCGEGKLIDHASDLMGD